MSWLHFVGTGGWHHTHSLGPVLIDSQWKYHSWRQQMRKIFKVLMLVSDVHEGYSRFMSLNLFDWLKFKFPGSNLNTV